MAKKRRRPTDIEEKTKTAADEERDEVLPFKYTMSSYGADYPVDGLVKRLRKGDILVPEFQRDFVWKQKQASRFVESLLLGLPVPGIFLSKERDTGKLLVIDGQQRLHTLLYFYDGIWPKNRQEFSLQGVQKRFVGTTYKSLSPEDRRRMDDSIIHATIVRQDEPSDDDSSVYHVFERLNTGGTQLKPQEIRACVYHGELIKLLKALNKHSAWRSIYGRVSDRMKDQELILRFLALYFKGKDYKAPMNMKEFLNEYNGGNRHLTVSGQSRTTLARVFEQTIQLAHDCIGSKAFRPVRTLNAAVFDAVMVALARRLEKGAIQRPRELARKYENLLANTKFLDACTTGTSQPTNVNLRLVMATRAFSSAK